MSSTSRSTDGEFLVLVGPSGCGKSTLLRLIAGLEEVSAGEIRIGGTPVNDLPPKDRDIAMVFQSYALYPHMSVADNMAYSLRLRGSARPRSTRAVHGSGASSGLETLLDAQAQARSPAASASASPWAAPSCASPGLPVRRAAVEPRRAPARADARARSSKLHRELGATSIYVTHDQIEAMTLADRIVALNGGHVQQVGSPLELYDRPANLFVAGFIGSPAMNMFPAHLRARAAQPC